MKREPAKNRELSFGIQDSMYARSWIPALSHFCTPAGKK